MPLAQAKYIFQEVAVTKYVAAILLFSLNTKITAFTQNQLQSPRKSNNIKL